MCVCVFVCAWVCVSRCSAFAIPQTLHLPPGTSECVSFVSQPLEGRDKSWQSIRWRVRFPPKALRRGTWVNLKALTSADTSTCHVNKQAVLISLHSQSKLSALDLNFHGVRLGRQCHATARKTQRCFIIGEQVCWRNGNAVMCYANQRHVNRWGRSRHFTYS